MTAQDTQRFLAMSLALTGERDREALLSMILDTAMDVARCDAGTLYLLEDDALRFCRMVTRSQGIRQGGHDAPITLPPVPLEDKYVCSWAALHAQSINVPDVRSDTRFDFTGSLRYDAMTGYRTVSMLVVPMRNDKGEILGVTQLINACDRQGNVVPFDPEIELLVSAISSQAAISITNMQYSEQITALMDSLVAALTTAIDERSSYNANHTRNMVRLGERFLDWLDASGQDWRFDAESRRCFLMSVSLHDVGKLIVPLEVMDKQNRLGTLLRDVEQRFARMALLGRIEALEDNLSPEACAATARERDEALALIRRVDTAGFLTDDDLAALDALAARRYTDESGASQPWLTDEELHRLRVRKGTLTEEERAVMQGHALMTAHILSQVQFPRSYARVPQWAAAHHELLNGSGYPFHLTADAIPREVRLLTILDVFEALTARDRPYKPPMPAEKALAILDSMVAEGAIDADVLALFKASRAWEGQA